MKRLVLASTSPYRAELLARLQLPFETMPPGVDETPSPGESPHDYVCRLAMEKARAVAPQAGSALIIGSDQIALLGERWLRKPGTPERAEEQLAACSGRCVTFLTGVAVHDSAHAQTRHTLVPYRVYFRELDRARIRRYVERERPLDSAGAFRMEGLGISLFARLEGDDPNALVGLPLIALVDLLAAFGLHVP